MKWVVTNHRGMRRCSKNGKTMDMDSINCVKETDPNTGAVTTIREDKVLLVEFKDGSILCQHQDGTQLYTSADKTNIRIEKSGQLPVEVTIGEPFNQEQENDEMVTHPEERALDGIVRKVLLPDNSYVKSFKDVKNSDDEQGNLIKQEVNRHLIHREDYSVVIVESQGDGKGEVTVISSNARACLNELGYMNRMGRDIDYLNQLSRRDGVMNECVYYA
jgi:hypothetical protein